MVKVPINNTKHITIANIYIPPRDTTSTHYKTADIDIQHCMQYIMNIPPSVLTGDANAHSTLWHSYTDDHRGQLIADVISNSDHITLNTNTPTRVPNTTLQQTSSPDITTVSNTLYNRTSWTTQHALSSDHLPIITTINIRHDYRLQQNRRTFTNYKKADWTQFTEDTESAFAQTTIPTNIHTANRIFTNIILIVPVFKSGDRIVPSNYRPISLTSVIIKVFERVIRKQIVTFLISKGHLHPTQHGFRGGHSCLSALLSVFDDVIQLLNSGNNTLDMVYLDFAKAFDKVDHGVLLHKIKMLGITGKLGVWLYHFLTGRTHFVR